MILWRLEKRRAIEGYSGHYAREPRERGGRAMRNLENHGNPKHGSRIMRAYTSVAGERAGARRAGARRGRGTTRERHDAGGQRERALERTRRTHYAARASSARIALEWAQREVFRCLSVVRLSMRSFAGWHTGKCAGARNNVTRSQKYLTQQSNFPNRNTPRIYQPRPRGSTTESGHRSGQSREVRGLTYCTRTSS